MPVSSNPNKTVLFIAYYFPPAGGGGVQRPTKFVKYLPQFGWQPVVLTATEDSFVETDEEMIKDIPGNVIIERVKPWLSKRQTHRIRSQTRSALPNENSSSSSLKAKLATWVRTLILIPDSQVFWVIPAAFRMRQLLKKHKPDVIFATAPPYSVLLLGVVAKWFSRKPLVSDFRDPWSEWLLTLRKDEPQFRKRIETWLEKRVLQKSTHVISPTSSMRNYFRQQYSYNRSTQLDLIYNGYDETDFIDIKPKKFTRFSIVYTGKIIPNLYSALPFLKAFVLMLENEPKLRNQIEVHFLGAFDESPASELIREKQLQNTIKIHGYLPHSQCVSYQLSADLLLLLQNKDSLEGITGKIFEYFRANKTILAIIPENSAAAEVLKSARIGNIVSPDKPDAIAKKLNDLITSSPNGNPSGSATSQFNRKKQAQKLSEIFNSLFEHQD